MGRCGERAREDARAHRKVQNSHTAMVARALALLLACSNRIVSTDQLMREGDWGDDLTTATWACN